MSKIFKDRQRSAIGLLRNGCTRSEVCSQLRIDMRTLNSWLQDVDFAKAATPDIGIENVDEQAMKTAENDNSQGEVSLQASALNKLKKVLKYADSACETLEFLKNHSRSESVRYQAANRILDMAETLSNINILNKNNIEPEVRYISDQETREYYLNAIDENCKIISNAILSAINDKESKIQFFEALESLTHSGDPLLSSMALKMYDLQSYMKVKTGLTTIEFKEMIQKSGGCIGDNNNNNDNDDNNNQTNPKEGITNHD